VIGSIRAYDFGAGVRRLATRFAALAVVLGAGLATSAVRADDVLAPDALVKKVSNDVLDAIRADKSLQTGDPAKLQSLVDTKVMPVVDFERMTQLSVGRPWRGATPEQRDALAKEFRTLLIRTYSGAMAQVRDHHVEMKPLRAAPTDTEVVVRSQIVSSSSDPIQLDYRLEKKPEGWRIFDVNVLGVWLIETYRSQFKTEIEQGGIDGLIKSLAQRNATNAK